MERGTLSLIDQLRVAIKKHRIDIASLGRVNPTLKTAPGGEVRTGVPMRPGCSVGLTNSRYPSKGIGSHITGTSIAVGTCVAHVVEVTASVVAARNIAHRDVAKDFIAVPS